VDSRHVTVTDESTLARSGGLARTAVIVLVAAVLAAGVRLNPATATTAGACGWYAERAGAVGGQWVWDSWAGAYDYVQFQIVTYNDGCGSRFYRLHEWTSTGTWAYLHLDIRVWVCGRYQGIWTATPWSPSSYIQTPSFFYGGCGPQADDWSSWIGNQWAFSPNPGSAYVTS